MEPALGPGDVGKFGTRGGDTGILERTLFGLSTQLSSSYPF